MIATPATLITLLLTVAHGWRQQALAESIDKIREAGLELYKRLLTMAQHFVETRRSDREDGRATYNNTVGSLERNVLSSARKFKELRPANGGATGRDECRSDTTPRHLDASKWQSGAVKRG